MTAKNVIVVEDSSLDLGALSLNDAGGSGGGWIIRFTGASLWRLHDEVDCADGDPTVFPTPVNQTGSSNHPTAEPTINPRHDDPTPSPSFSPTGALSPSPDPTHAMLPIDEAQTPYSHEDSYSYSYSYGSAPAVVSCAASCSTDVLEAIEEEDQTAACALDLKCASDCFSETFVNAHCACNSGAMFASYSYDFAGSEAYCCSSDDGCDEAVQALYRELLVDSPVNNASALAEYLDQQCANVSCASKPSPPTSMPTPPPNRDCAVTWIGSNNTDIETTKFDLGFLSAIPNEHDTLSGASFFDVHDFSVGCSLSFSFSLSLSPRTRICLPMTTRVARRFMSSFI